LIFLSDQITGNMFRPGSGHIQATLLHKSKTQLFITYV